MRPCQTRPKTSLPTSSSRTSGEAHPPGHEPHVQSPVCVCAEWETGLRPGRSGALPGPPPSHHGHPLSTGPMSAAQCLAHPWPNNLAEKAKRCNRRLKSQILLKKYLMKSWGTARTEAGRREGYGVGKALAPLAPVLAGSVWKTELAFSLFVLGWLLPWVVASAHPPPWGGASFYGLGFVE